LDKELVAAPNGEAAFFAKGEPKGEGAGGSLLDKELVAAPNGEAAFFAKGEPKGEGAGGSLLDKALTGAAPNREGGGIFFVGGMPKT
jgi:hypothetical protein